MTPPERRAEDLQRAEFEGELRAFMAETRDDVRSILEQTKKTNGRVTALEQENVAAEARATERAKVLSEQAEAQATKLAAEASTRAEKLKTDNEKRQTRMQRYQWKVGLIVTSLVALLVAILSLAASHG